MREIKDNIWDAAKGHILVVTTNGDVRYDGACVMGRGLALQAARRFPGLPRLLGEFIKKRGNHVHYLGEWGEYGIVSFPVKHHWKESADLELIRRSRDELLALCMQRHVFLTRPGCQNGHLLWKDVKPIILKLSDQYTVCDWANS